MGRIRYSLLVQLNHIRASVGALRAINAAQQSGSDVPVLAAFSDNCDSLFVVAGAYQPEEADLPAETKPDHQY